MSTQTSDQLASTIEAIRDHLRQVGDSASASFSAETKLVTGFETRARIRQFDVTVDEPPTLGGTDRGPNPVEVVLAALGTCQEIVYATYARVLGIPLDSVSVQVTGELDPRGFFGVAEVSAGFRDVSFAVEVQSPADAEDIQRLISTVNAHCPVLDILQRALPVTGSYAHNGRVVVAAE